MPQITVTSPLLFLGIIFLVAGGFIFLAGQGIIKVESITVAQSKQTSRVGAILTVLGILLLIPDIFRALSPTTPLPLPETTTVLVITPTRFNPGSTESPTPPPPTPATDSLVPEGQPTSTPKDANFPGGDIPLHLWYPSELVTYPFKGVWLQDNLTSFSEYVGEIVDFYAEVTGIDSPPSVSAMYDPLTLEIKTSPKVDLPAGAQLHLYYKVHLKSNMPPPPLPALWQSGGKMGDCEVPPGYVFIHTTTYTYLFWGGRPDTQLTGPGPCYKILPYN